MTRDHNYTTLLEDHIIHDSRSPRAAMATIALFLMAGMLGLAWAQQAFGHDDFRPRELR